MSWLSEQRLSEIRARLVPVPAWLAPRIEQGRHWLTAPREPLTWAALRSKLTTLKLPSTYAGRLAVLGVIVLLLLPVLSWYAAEQKKDDKGAATYPHASLINPILGGLGALFLIYAAIRQARTASAQAEIARKQAQVASDRHEAQTKADQQRRITESFSRALEQLASEKIEIRVGGIYTLERIARDSLDDYWTVMETLTTFVRERAKWKGPGSPLAEIMSGYDDADRLAHPPEPAADIAAVLAVIGRRSEAGLDLQKQNRWQVNLRSTDLRGANLMSKNFDLVDFGSAHLEGGYLTFFRAHLRGVSFIAAHLEKADFNGADLSDAEFLLACIEGADLSTATLTGVDLSGAFGDAKTRLPDGMKRPDSWTPYEP
jgi:Pentapeptide repeats (8 copies)